MPPCDPGRPDFPGPVLPLAYHPACLPRVGEVQALTRIRPYPPRFTHGRALPGDGQHPGTVSGSRSSMRSCQMTRVSLPRAPRYRLWGSVASAASGGVAPPSSLVQTHAPDQIPPVTFGLGLCFRVFAGCCQPLLGGGPSQRYSPSPSLRAWTPTPAAPGVLAPVSSPKASAFPRIRLGRRFALIGRAISRPSQFRGCSHSFIFRPAGLLATQIAPTASGIAPKGGRGFYIRAKLGSLPHRASNMLAVRFGQLTAGDSHPIGLATLLATPLSG